MILINFFFIEKAHILYILSRFLYSRQDQDNALLSIRRGELPCGIPIKSNAPIFPARSSLRPRSTRDAYVKGLDNSTPESYSKLRRFLLRKPGRAVARPFSIPATRRSLATLLSLAHVLPPSPFTLHAPDASRELPSDSLTKCRFPSFP